MSKKKIIAAAFLTSSVAIAAILGVAQDIAFDPSNTSLSSSNLQSAIDEMSDEIQTIEQSSAQLGNQAPCPTGMVKINGLQICMDQQRTNNGFNAKFANANQICQNEGKRLCSAYELYAATKQTGVLPQDLCSSADGVNTEWSSTIYSASSATVTSSTRDSTTQVCKTTFTGDSILTTNTRQYKVRCCKDPA